MELVGWVYCEVYFLELIHNCIMGCYPAVTENDVPIIVTSRKHLKPVWMAIEKRPAKISSFWALFHAGRGIVFNIGNPDQDQPPLNCFTMDQVEKLCGEGEVDWRVGLSSIEIPDNVPEPDFGG